MLYSQLNSYMYFVLRCHTYLILDQSYPIYQLSRQLKSNYSSYIINFPGAAKRAAHPSLHSFVATSRQAPAVAAPPSRWNQLHESEQSYNLR